MALEALERYTRDEDIPWSQTEEAITAIKQALLTATPLAAPVQQSRSDVEPVLWLVNGVVQTSNIPVDYTGCLYTTPPAAPVQEPVAWRWTNSKGWLTYGELPHDKFESTPLYTTPPSDETQRLSALVRAQQITIDKLEAAQRQSAPVQEPVAIVSGYYGGQCVVLPTNPARLFNSGTAFYTTPPAAQPFVPLTDEQEREAFEAWAKSVGLIALSHGIRSESSQLELVWLAWKAKAAHGIKGAA